MKKILLAMVFCALTVGSAFAADIEANATTVFASDDELTITPASTSVALTVLKPSNNVSGAIALSSSQFSSAVKHLSGSRNFAASSTDTKIYWVATADANKGSSTLEITLTNSDTTEFADWTAL